MNLPPDPTLEEFTEVVSAPDDEIDLARAALVFAKTQYPDVEIEPLLEGLDALAARVRARMGSSTDPMDHVAALTSMLLRDFGLRAAEDNFYDPNNSFLNLVLERKRGIPITLSVVYMSVGARAGIALAGADVPMHFLVRVLGVEPPEFVDCYNHGKIMSEEEVRGRITRLLRGKAPFKDSMLEVVSNCRVISRLLNNLRVLYSNSMQFELLLPVLNRLFVLDPYQASLLRQRGIVYHRLGHNDLARQDLENYLASEIEPDDADGVRRFLRKIRGSG